jgi:hypothetical protein
VTMSKENKNQSGKRITETNLTGKKARKLSKNISKIDRLQNIPKGTSQNEKLVEIELRRDIKPMTLEGWSHEVMWTMDLRILRDPSRPFDRGDACITSRERGGPRVK